MSNEVGKTLKEAPKVGDRVTLRSAWLQIAAGESGVVTAIHGPYGARVKFDNGLEDYGFWTALMPESTPTAPDQAAPTHIVIEGVRYKLTPEPEAPAEKKREPSVGEIWCVHRELVLVTEDRNVRLHSGYMGEYDHERIKRVGTFVAASLAEGIRDGSITADNLKNTRPA